MRPPGLARCRAVVRAGNCCNRGFICHWDLVFRCIYCAGRRSQRQRAPGRWATWLAGGRATRRRNGPAGCRPSNADSLTPHDRCDRTRIRSSACRRATLSSADLQRYLPTIRHRRLVLHMKPAIKRGRTERPASESLPANASFMSIAFDSSRIAATLRKSRLLRPRRD